MRRFVFVLFSAALVFSCLPVAAQEQAEPQTAPSTTTTVSGHVICGDTGHPARFAAVLLIPEKPQPSRHFRVGEREERKGYGEAHRKKYGSDEEEHRAFRRQRDRRQL